MELGISTAKLSQVIFLILLINQFQVIGDWNKFKEFLKLLLLLKLSDILISAFFKILNFWPYIWHFDQSISHSLNTILFSWNGFSDYGKIGLWNVLFSYSKFNLISDFLSIILVSKYFKFKTLNNDKINQNKFIYPIFAFGLILSFGFIISDHQISSNSSPVNIPILTKEIFQENGSTFVWNIPFFYLLFFATGIITYYLYTKKGYLQVDLFKYSFLSYLVFLFFTEFFKNEIPYFSTFENYSFKTDINTKESWTGFSFSQIQSLFFGIIILIKSLKK
ncbi:hypothetical protein [Leptospira meyeri]|uniref:hypothetical protein n=1 Tax=Leptospira meyeri TaxID=29508 RepID=UPI00223CA81C|nr:hypothetical protein [Leptospira meyeri]MCW7490919.1 hypothetical protein [Leptospira meyeri]